MNHFPDELGPEYRYKNDILNELCKQTKLLEEILRISTLPKIEQPTPTQRPQLTKKDTATKPKGSAKK